MNRQKKNNGLAFPVVGLILFLVCCEFLWAGAAATPTSGPAEPPTELPAMSRYLPVWVRGYLEVYDLDRQFDYLHWLVPLIDHPDNLTDTKPLAKNPVPNITRQFDTVLKHNLNVSAKEFADQLLSDHFIIAWGGPAMRDQFALLCEVKDINAVNRFLTINKAMPDEVVKSNIDGKAIRVATYKLSLKSIRAAVIDNRWLILATVGGGKKASMYHGMVELAQGHSEMSLQENPEFRQACSRMKPGYASMFILLMDSKNRLHLPNGDTVYDQIQERISHISLAGYPQKDTLKIRANVQPRWVDPELLPDQPITPDPLLRKMIDPKSNLVYMSSVNPNRWYRRISELAEHDHGDTRQYRDMIDMALPDQEFRDNLLEAIGPEMMVIVSREGLSAGRSAPVATATTTQSGQSKSSVGSKPMATQIALVIKSKNPSLTMAAASQMFDLLSGLHMLRAFISGNGTQASQSGEDNYHGVTVHRVNLGQLIPADSKNRFGGWSPEPAWTQIQDYLLLSSSPDLIHRLIDRAFGPEDSSSFGQVMLAELPPEIHWAMSFKPGEVAKDMKNFREVFEHFWKTMKGNSPGELSRMPVVLGIGTRVISRNDRPGSMLQVAAVLPGYPSWDRLKVGDILVSVDGQPIGFENPQKELHDKVIRERSASSIRFGILRKGDTMEVEVPLGRRSFNHTVQTLKMLTGILRTLGTKFNRIDLACRYTPEGQIFLDCNFVAKKIPAPATQPAPRTTASLPATRPATLPAK